jgi:hypothetical protein
MGEWVGRDRVGCQVRARPVGREEIEVGTDSVWTTEEGGVWVRALGRAVLNCYGVGDGEMV